MPEWLDAIRLAVVVSYPVLQPGPRDRLHVVQRDGSGLAPLPLPDEPGCRITEHLFPRRLNDGRLAYLAQCVDPWDPARQQMNEQDVIVAYDPATGHTAPLMPYRLHGSHQDFAFAPDLSLGIINDGRGLNSRLEWLRKDRVVRVELGFPQVFAPSWSPDGATIAFAAMPDDRGRQGMDRIGLPLTLYLMDVATQQLRALTDGFSEAGRPAWSPDGRWLAFSMNLRSPKRRLWLIEVTTGRRFLLADWQTASASWSPDGMSLATEYGIEWRLAKEPKGPVGIKIIDLPNLNRLSATPSPTAR